MTGLVGYVPAREKDAAIALIFGFWVLGLKGFYS
jgi:hypothetical protein